MQLLTKNKNTKQPKKTNKNSTAMEPTNNFLQTHKNGATHAAILIQIKKINKLSSGNNNNDGETHPLPSAKEDEWLFPFLKSIFFFFSCIEIVCGHESLESFLLLLLWSFVAFSSSGGLKRRQRVCVRRERGSERATAGGNVHMEKWHLCHSNSLCSCIMHI